MSASITAAPARTSFGRLPLALAALALVVVAALAVAMVAMNSAKAVAPATSAAKGAPPAVIDHGWSSAVDYGQSVSNVPFYDHGWSKINEPGQSVSNVPFYDHGWSIAGTSATPRADAYFGPYYYNGYDSYAPFDATKGASTATGYPPFGASYGTSVNRGYPLSGASYFQSVPLRIHAIDEGARGDRVIEPQYVAPRPRNQ